MIYCRKRKCNWDEPITHSSIELQLKNPLPLDWEQCLDLQSGRMYYLNGRTLKKSWDWPRDQKLDLELNISPSSIFADQTTKIISASTRSSEEARKIRTTNISHTTNMVAVACIKCHLLVMLCKSSPSCPNCKYAHSLSSPGAVAAVEAPADGDRGVTTRVEV
ncbi:hypothetical protein QJS10_CPB18g00444 [Acorus calamus]|uniref:WW domain-containing protein n=1 Tax=Acorus calamus TaxID=4465 RepID=A0AAV9CQL2_ACOCL|nr:hypothetical protein QJS10_CPB18g00444 [Acorus calamus]